MIFHRRSNFSTYDISSAICPSVALNTIYSTIHSNSLTFSD